MIINGTKIYSILYMHRKTINNNGKLNTKSEMKNGEDTANQREKKTNKNISMNDVPSFKQVNRLTQLIYCHIWCSYFQQLRCLSSCIRFLFSASSIYIYIVSSMIQSYSSIFICKSTMFQINALISNNDGNHCSTCYYYIYSFQFYFFFEFWNFMKTIFFKWNKKTENKIILMLCCGKKKSHAENNHVDQSATLSCMFTTYWFVSSTVIWIRCKWMTLMFQQKSEAKNCSYRHSVNVKIV